MLFLFPFSREGEEIEYKYISRLVSVQVSGCSANFRSSVVFRHSNQSLSPNDGWNAECAQRNSGTDWRYNDTGASAGCSSKSLSQDLTRCDCMGGGEIALLAFKMQIQVRKIMSLFGYVFSSLKLHAISFWTHSTVCTIFFISPSNSQLSLVDI